MRAKRLIPLAAGLLFAGLAALAAGTASAKQVKYVGIHPIPGAGGAFCYIEFPHVHVYEPAHADVLYRPHEGGHHFVGDPVAHGYDGPKHAFYGHHPVQVSVGGHFDDSPDFCYLDGPHYHEYVPAASARFVVKGGVYWYTGDFPKAYVEARPRLGRVNVVYKPIRYERPVVVVEPPREYHGHLVEVEAAPVEVEVVAPAPHVRAGVGVAVEVPAPVLEVEIGLPGVVVTGPRHHHDHVVVVPGKVKHERKGHRRGRGRGHWDD